MTCDCFDKVWKYGTMVEEKGRAWSVNGNRYLDLYDEVQGYSKSIGSLLEEIEVVRSLSLSLIGIPIVIWID